MSNTPAHKSPLRLFRVRVSEAQWGNVAMTSVRYFQAEREEDLPAIVSGHRNLTFVAVAE